MEAALANRDRRRAIEDAAERGATESALEAWLPDAGRPGGWMVAAALSGAIACIATAAAAAAAGKRASGSAVAPINATSHVVYGERAAAVENVDVRHTAVGAAINFGASAFWAAIYEAAFGRAAERGDVAKAAAGGVAVAALAYAVDYHVVPKRLTPGWEARMPARSLFPIYCALAIALPLRGLLGGARTRRRSPSSR